MKELLCDLAGKCEKIALEFFNNPNDTQVHFKKDRDSSSVTVADATIMI